MNIPKLGLLSGALIGALSLGGCATVTRGTSETLLIQSQPSGANVRVSNGFTGLTPASFTVPRKGDLIVTVSMPGYESQEHVLHAEVAGKGAAGVAGNALIGGVIGIGVDVATGAALSHKPNPLVVTLKPVAGMPEQTAPQVLPPPVAATPPAEAMPERAATKEVPGQAAAASATAADPGQAEPGAGGSSAPAAK